uniref:Uncharacterized protein n=1 Tax=Utricularia reniformis TaxID=192314 RepID=A0A1Y0AZW9_9LAMI|nr:hypothetical protein AEK19_MT0465 [Utricularia reniformis]ART30725.1 hypothetical protein AEK19_MT0465 [Utricularia reniformis]
MRSEQEFFPGLRVGGNWLLGRAAALGIGKEGKGRCN